MPPRHSTAAPDLELTAVHAWREVCPTPSDGAASANQQKERDVRETRHHETNLSCDRLDQTHTLLPNGSRLSCGRNARRRKAAERQKKGWPARQRNSSPTSARQLQAHVRPPRCVYHDALPGLAPLQAHQSAHRKDGGEKSGHAERDEYPDERECVGSGEGAGDAIRPHEMDNRHPEREE